MRDDVTDGWPETHTETVVEIPPGTPIVREHDDILREMIATAPFYIRGELLESELGLCGECERPLEFGRCAWGCGT